MPTATDLTPAAPPRPIKRSFRMKLMIAVFFVSVLIPSLVVWRIYEKGKELQLDGLRRRLMSTAAMLAESLDGDLHQTLPHDKSAADLPAYRELLRVCRIVKDAAPEDFGNVYTIVKSEPAGWGVIVLDVNEEDTGRRYEYGRFPEFVRGFESIAADYRLTEDEDGLWLSGYAPLRNSAGEVVAAVGIDVAGKTVLNLRAELQHIALINILSSMILAYGLAILASDWLSKPVRSITHAMERIAGGDLEASTDIHSGDEFENISVQFNRMVAGLRERDKLKASLIAAREIQENLLPREAPRVAGLEIAGVSDYCDETGGDYYDYWTLPGGRQVAVALGDVSGHGVGSALLMAAARMNLRSLSAQGSDNLGRLFTEMNSHLCRDVPPGKFLTLFFAILDLDTGTLRWVSAGHDPALLYRAKAGDFEELRAGGLPLGIEDGVEYDEGETRPLAPGDMLVVGTDGIWEARNETLDLFSHDRYVESVRSLRDHSAADVCRHMLARVHAFRGASPQLDDITLIVAKVAGEGTVTGRMP